MDKLDKNKIDELLPRYCEGQVTEEERLLVEIGRASCRERV